MNRKRLWVQIGTVAVALVIGWLWTQRPSGAALLPTGVTTIEACATQGVVANLSLGSNIIGGVTCVADLDGNGLQEVIVSKSGSVTIINNNGTIRATISVP